jgi:hypothetical protein
MDLQFKGGKVPAKGSLTMTSEDSNIYPLMVAGSGGTYKATILTAFLKEWPEMPRRLDARCLFL